MVKVERKAAREGNEVKQVFLPHCTWDKFGDILANSGARSFGLFDELVSFFSTMNMYNTTKMQVSDTKEYQDFLQMFTGKTKTRETITGNANYKMTQTSFTLMGFTQPQTALLIIQDDQNNAKGFTSRLLWFFPEPVFCKLQDTILDAEESSQLKRFTNKLIKFLAGLYTEGEKSYTIEGGERVTTVTVSRQKFKLSQEAHKQFESIHDEWELTICKKYPHDAFVGGLYSRGKSHILRLAVTIQLLLSFWNDMESQPSDSQGNAKHSGEVHHDSKHQSGSDDAQGSDEAQDSDNEYDNDDTLGSENEGFDACQFVGSDAVNIASSIVSTCLAQLCTLNEKMHVIRQLDGDNEQTMESSSRAEGSTNISVFGRLYSTILLTHGEVVSLSILNQRGIFRKPCNGLHAKNLMLKVLDDMTALGLGKVETFQIPGNRFQVYFFKKSPVPDDHEKLNIFIQMLAKCGISLPSYTTSLTAQDEERKKHQDDYDNRQDPNYNSPTKKRKL